MDLYIKGVSTLKIDAGKCVGCGLCLEVCPRAVIELRDGRAHAAVKDACIECGACARNCPFGAVSVEAGVGCATAMLNGAFGATGDCGCSCGGDAS